MWTHKHVDPETLNPVQRRARWCGYRNTVQRRARWCGYRNTVQRMTRWCGYRNTARCTMNGQETKKAENLHTSWSRDRQDRLLGRASDREDRHNTDRLFNSPVWPGIFLPVSSQCRLSYGISTAPVCNCMYQHLCIDQKSQTFTAIPLIGHTKILNTLTGLGSIVPMVSVATPSSGNPNFSQEIMKF